MGSDPFSLKPMIKQILLSTAVLVAGFTGAAQAQNATQPCATDQMTQLAEKRFPEQIAQSQAKWQQIIDASLRKMDLSKFAKSTFNSIDTTTVYHIPIVFHIIHNYDNMFTDLTDNEIYNSVVEINALYNRVNGGNNWGDPDTDTTGIIRPYKNLIPGTSTKYVGKTKFVFHLAQIDPQGNPTNGITRRRHYLTLKGGDLGKLDGWAPDSYVNVWVNKYLTNAGAAQYAYQPTSVDNNPAMKVVDGVMAGWAATTRNGQLGINNDMTVGHELGHVFSLAHPWGNTNSPGVACGDDGVFDTPPTQGHGAGAPTSPRNITGCTGNDYNLFDTVCTTNSVFLGKPTPDTFGVGAKFFIDATNAANRIDSTINDGITFDAYSLFYLKSVDIYCGDSGQAYKIGLTESTGRNIGIYYDTFRVAKGRLVTVPLNFKVPPGKNYTLNFLVNHGVYMDTNAAVVPYRKISGVVYLTSVDTAVRRNYRYFYNWNINHGFFKVYDTAQYRSLYSYDTSGTIPPQAVRIPEGGLLVDYPDTTNAQNVMDYTYCSKMFTAGQSQRMRLAASSPVANRNKLSTISNLTNTGITDANGNFLPRLDTRPVADFSYGQNGGAVEQMFVSDAPTGSNSAIYNYSDVVYKCAGKQFLFYDRTTGDTIGTNGIQWTFSNGAAPVTTSNNFTTPVRATFTQPGWATVTVVATSNAGSDTETRQAVYLADPNNKISPIGYWQDFNDQAEVARWPNFNYYNNDFKWEMSNVGPYDQTSMRYNCFDYRYGVPNPVASLPGSTPNGDFDDFFSPPFDLSNLTNSNYLSLNFMYAGASRSSVREDVNDTFQVFGSTDCGDSWQSVGIMSKRTLNNNGVVSTPFVPSGLWNWQSGGFNIKPLVNSGTDNILFRFRYRPGVEADDQGARLGTGNNFYIDRIFVSNTELSVDDKQLDAQGMVLAPNPTNAGTSIVLKNATGDVNITVSDITGKIIYRSQEQGTGSRTTINIPAAVLSVKGMYLVQVATNGFSQTQKLVVN